MWCSFACAPLPPSTVWLTQQVPRGHMVPLLDAKDKDFNSSWKHCQMHCLQRSTDHLYLGHWFKLAENMSLAVPTGGQLINKGVCTLSFWELRVSGEDSKEVQEEFLLEGAIQELWHLCGRWFGCDGKANGFSSGEHRDQLLAYLIFL